MRSVLLVDDHLEAQQRMRAVLEEVFPSSSLALASTVATARALIGRRAFDLAVLDLSLPDGRGESLIEPLRAVSPDCLVVVWSMHDQTSRLIDVLAKGANGYLLKDQTVEALRQAFLRLPFGEPPLSSSVTRRMIEYIQESGGGAGTGRHDPNRVSNGDLPAIAEALTEREKEILVLLSKGFNRPDIAGILSISKSTVATHVAHIYAKLNVSSRIDAVEMTRRLGLLQAR